MGRDWLWPGWRDANSKGNAGLCHPREMLTLTVWESSEGHSQGQ